MVKGKYLMALAVIAGLALFFVGAYEMDSKDKDAEESNETIDVTLTIQKNLIVTVNGVKIASGVTFQTKGDVDLSITLPATGSYKLEYKDSGSGEKGSSDEFGHKGDVLNTTIFVTPGYSSNVTGSITFHAHS